ncbi:MAG: hypothetical protein Q9162_001222 [Coniocarpon cinnabarinum]
MAAAAEVQPPPALPDYLTNPNAVLGDVEASWRYGQPPDYSKTRSYFEARESEIHLRPINRLQNLTSAAAKTSNHEAGSLPELVQNLVKNWEVEASFKTKLSDWRTINPDEYSFSINGRDPQTGEEMLKIGTYNAIIQPGNEYYSPEHSTFAQSHKTFKRMMPTFAWEVLDVIGAPPAVGIKWRHWGTMKDDYVGFNDKGEKVIAKAHGGPIELKGTTWAWVDDKVRVKKLETWFDPLEMFRQIAPNGIVNKETVKPEAAGVTPAETVVAPKTDAERLGTQATAVSRNSSPSHEDFVDVSHPDKSSDGVLSSEVSGLGEGSAVALANDDRRTTEAHEEMSKITPLQCPFMNKE